MENKKLSKIFYTGIKYSKWFNVHYEFETAEGGAWFTSGDEYLMEFRDKWLYFLGIPIYRFYCKSKIKGLYSQENNIL